MSCRRCPPDGAELYHSDHGANSADTRRESGVVVSIAPLPNNPLNRIRGEAALREETLLTCAFGRVLGRHAKAARPGVEGPLALGGTQCCQHRGADLRIEPMGLQLLLDSTKSEAR